MIEQEVADFMRKAEAALLRRITRVEKMNPCPRITARQARSGRSLPVDSSNPRSCSQRSTSLVQSEGMPTVMIGSTQANKDCRSRGNGSGLPACSQRDSQRRAMRTVTIIRSGREGYETLP